MPRSTKRRTGDTAPTFRAYIDRTVGVPEPITSATFELERRVGTAGGFTVAATVPADGVVELAPSGPQMALDPGSYRWRFACALGSGETWTTPWELVEITD